MLRLVLEVKTPMSMNAAEAKHHLQRVAYAILSKVLLADSPEEMDLFDVVHKDELRLEPMLTCDYKAPLDAAITLSIHTR